MKCAAGQRSASALSEVHLWAAGSLCPAFFPSTQLGTVAWETEAEMLSLAAPPSGAHRQALPGVQAPRLSGWDDLGKASSSKSPEPPCLVTLSLPPTVPEIECRHPQRQESIQGPPGRHLKTLEGALRALKLTLNPRPHCPPSEWSGFLGTTSGPLLPHQDALMPLVAPQAQRQLRLLGASPPLTSTPWGRVA